MNYLDIIISIPIVFGIIMGVKRGVVKEVLALAGIVLGIFVSRAYAGDAAAWLHDNVSTWDANLLRPIAAFSLFILTALVCNLLAYLLTKLFKLISLGWLNRLIGGVFGAVKWVLIVSIIVLCVDMLDSVLHFIRPEIKESSILYAEALNLMQSLKVMIAA